MKKTPLTKADQKKIFVRILRYIYPQIGTVILSLLLAFASVVLTLYVPILTGRSIDCLVSSSGVDFYSLFQFMIIIAVCVAVTSLLQWIMNYLNNRVTYHVIQNIRKEAFAHIQKLPLSYLDRHSTGDLLSRMAADVDTFADGLLMGFTQFFTGVMTILGTLFFMIRLNPVTAVLVIVLTPISMLVARFISSKTYTMFRKQSVIRGEQTALIDESIGELKLVQAFGHEEKTMAQFDEVNEKLGECSLQATFFSSLTNPCTRFVNSLVYAAVALAGAFTVLKGGMTVGGLSSFLSYATQYTKPFNEISGVVTELQNAIACAGRIFELIDAEEEKEPADAVEDLSDVQGEISIDNVCFSYTPDKPLIRDFSLEAAKGKHVAIVGPTGCGKTTLINLLMRFYDVDKGAILLDGHPTMKLKRRSLRHMIGMVLQDTCLFSGTIRDNIAMGKPDATDEEVIEAAKASHAHSFIKRLPEGYQTVITEQGGLLSQGQKQLLCIARLMLCLPPVLILDEATSSIDTRTEMKIQNAFNTMMKGRTSFIVAHRLSTIQNADMILVMNDGRIVEQGTHESLMAADGFYAHLYRSQFEN